jgi:hypothetical protein
MVCTSDFDPKTLTSGGLFSSEHNSRYFNKKARPAGLGRLRVGLMPASREAKRRQDHWLPAMWLFLAAIRILPD